MSRAAARLDIRISNEIRNLLGADGVQAVTALRTLASARCLRCHRKLPARGPAVVVLLRSPAVLHTVYAHPSCSRSVVLDLPDDLLAQIPPDADMTVTAVLLSHEDAMLPGLIAELTRMRLFLAFGSTARVEAVVDATVSRQLELGFTLLPDLRQVPADANSWSAVVGASGADGGSRLDIIDPTGALFYGGQVFLPPGWDEAARSLGRCVLFAGAIELPPGDAGTGLVAAAAAGGLTGATIPVSWA